MIVSRGGPLLIVNVYVGCRRQLVFSYKQDKLCRMMVTRGRPFLGSCIYVFVGCSMLVGAFLQSREFVWGEACYQRENLYHLSLHFL